MARLTLPRVAMSLVGALLLAYAFAIAPGAGPRGREPVPSDQAAVREPSPSPSPSEVFPPTEKVFIGIATKEGPHDFTPVDTFTATAKHHPQVMLFGSGWATDTFDRALFDAVRDRGMLPMLAWEPWDYRVDEEARKKEPPAARSTGSAPVSPTTGCPTSRAATSTTTCAPGPRGSRRSTTRWPSGSPMR